MDFNDFIPFLEEKDDDISLFDYILNTKNRIYHYLDREPGVFNLENLVESYCFNHFRFYKNHIRQLVRLLNIPEEMTLKAGVKVSGEEALCILLHRLSYPNRYVDLMKFFPRGQSALSEIFNHMIDHISREKGHVLKNFNQSYLSQDQIEIFCESVSGKGSGSPYKHCFGFIDGTVRQICLPSSDQREFYNGYKRCHSIKFQSVVIPNGIVFNMFGSITGRRHDGHLLAKSKLIQKMQQKFNGFENPPHLYGDAGYHLSKFIIVPFKGNLTPRKKRINKIMSELRVSVEWGFNKIIQLFPFVDFKKNLKIRKQKVPQFYKVATILTNCHTCLYGSQVCHYFECDPPLLEEYLN